MADQPGKSVRHPVANNAIHDLVKHLDDADGKIDGRIHRPAADSYLIRKAFESYLEIRASSPLPDCPINREIHIESVAFSNRPSPICVTGITNGYDVLREWLHRKTDAFSTQEATADLNHMQARMIIATRYLPR